VVVDLRDLSVKENIIRGLFAWPRDELSKYVGKQEFLLIVTSCKNFRDEIPEGDFLEFLEKVGSGEKLQRLLRILTHMDDRPMPPPDQVSGGGGYAYSLVATMAENDGSGLEAASLTTSQVLDFKFEWNDQLKQYLPVGYSRPLEQPE
jgi:hypothetical protein